MKARLAPLFGGWLLCLAFAPPVGAQPAPADGRQAVPRGTLPPWAARFEQEAVATDHPLASQAAAEVLAAGGSAADAAAAAMLALGVVNPASSGLGGGGFALYWDAGKQELAFLDFREQAPAAAAPDMFVRAPKPPGGGPLSTPSQLGGLASGVPGEPAGIEALLQRFGQLDWKTVVAPALRYATEGFAVSEELSEASAPFAEQMKRDPVMRRWFASGAARLQVGQRLRRPALARVLRVLARVGARGFYRGPLARRLAADVRRAGGILRAADLADYRVRWRRPIEQRAFGLRWVSAPPPSAGGFTLAMALQVLQRTAPAWRQQGEAAFLHAFAEALKGPYLDRMRYAADPDARPVPLGRLLEPRRAALRAATFSPWFALPARDYDLPLEERGSGGGDPVRDAGTSHLCVVDAAGNVAAVTTTVNLPFGARYTAAGVVMNDEMDDFATAPGQLNAFGLPGGEANLPAPGKRPVSSMSPTLVFDAQGRLLACAGASGGSRIPVATLQVLLRALVLGQPLPEALGAPRVHHQGIPPELRVEESVPLPEALQAELRALGHRIRPIGRVAVVQAVVLERDEPGAVRALWAGSDPRKGGRPAGR